MTEYRIALRPDNPDDDPMDHATRLDDIVVRDVPMFRAEQMGVNEWWVCCYLTGGPDGHEDDDRITWWVSSDTPITWRTTEYPLNTTYESDGA